MFANIQEYLSNPEVLVVILIDEVRVTYAAYLQNGPKNCTSVTSSVLWFSWWRYSWRHLEGKRRL